MTRTSRSIHAVIPGFRAPDALLHIAQVLARLALVSAPARICTWRSGMVVTGAVAILVVPVVTLVAATVLVVLQLSLIVICNLPAASRAVFSSRPGLAKRSAPERSRALFMGETLARLGRLFTENNRERVG